MLGNDYSDENQIDDDNSRIEDRKLIKYKKCKVKVSIVDEYNFNNN